MYNNKQTNKQTTTNNKQPIRWKVIKMQRMSCVGVGGRVCHLLCLVV